MNSKLVAEWSRYNIALYSTQLPPPLGTVDTDEKLEQMAREHLVKVAGEGAMSAWKDFDSGSNSTALQVLSCTSLEVLACGRPTKPTVRLSINGQLSPVCCETALHVTWRYQLVLLLNHNLGDK